MAIIRGNGSSPYKEIHPAVPIKIRWQDTGGRHKCLWKYIFSLKITLSIVQVGALLWRERRALGQHGPAGRVGAAAFFELSHTG